MRLEARLEARLELPLVRLEVRLEVRLGLLLELPELQGRSGVLEVQAEQDSRGAHDSLQAYC